MIKILMSDDDERIFQSCRKEAESMGIVLVCFKNWEAAQEELDLHFDDYSAVVLDGKGQRNADSKEGDEKHVVQAMGWLREQRGKNRYIPTVIYTAYIESFHLFEGDEVVLKIFDKNDSEGFVLVLKFLVAQAANLSSTRIKKKYPEVFEVLREPYLSSDLEKRVVKIIEQLDEADIKVTLNEIRMIVEGILLRANKVSDSLFPEKLIDKNEHRPILQFARFYFTRPSKDGKPFIIETDDGNVTADPDLMKGPARAAFNYLIDVTQPGSHYNQQFKTKNALRCAVFALMELICWFKHTVDTKFS